MTDKEFVILTFPEAYHILVKPNRWLRTHEILLTKSSELSYAVSSISESRAWTYAKKYIEGEFINKLNDR